MEVEILYTNYKKETARRRIVPEKIYFGSTPYHPEEQWMLRAFDISKKEYRDFAMKDISAWKPLIEILRAEKTDLVWINKRYDEVKFVHSSFENELIAVAKFGGEIAGIGRLARLSDASYELGGIYVFEPFRGRGLARAIVQFLLKNTTPAQKIFCIPFAELVPFYKEFGFAAIEPEEAPEAIRKKVCYCKANYPKPCGLLVKN